ncbi:MAG: TIGR04086 family membrane protein [Clostridia bacterium]|nr:TIGR04086 family membrane protein [Clostridia bacterium]
MSKNSFNFPKHNKGDKSSSEKVIIFGTVIGVLATVLAVFVFAAIMLLFKIDRAYASLMATVSVAIGAFTTALTVSKRASLKGYICGALTGLVYFLVITLISLIVDRQGLTSNTVFHLVIIVLSGFVGGVLGANKR